MRVIFTTSTGKVVGTGIIENGKAKALTGSVEKFWVSYEKYKHLL